jgi:hypothetical protein
MAMDGRMGRMRIRDDENKIIVMVAQVLNITRPLNFMLWMIFGHVNYILSILKLKRICAMYTQCSIT